MFMSFPTPDLREYYKSRVRACVQTLCAELIMGNHELFQPGYYLSHLIGHEGPGSLLSELKARGKEPTCYRRVVLSTLLPQGG